jgi:hypothetical protein
MPENLTCSVFAGCLHDSFRVHVGPEPVEVELIEARELSSRAPRPPELGPRQPFALLFRGPRAAPFGQRTYRVEHDRLGAFDLFLVPVGPDDQGLRYEAIFN